MLVQASSSKWLIPNLGQNKPEQGNTGLEDGPELPGNETATDSEENRSIVDPFEQMLSNYKRNNFLEAQKLLDKLFPEDDGWLESLGTKVKEDDPATSTVTTETEQAKETSKSLYRRIAVLRGVGDAECYCKARELLQPLADKNDLRALYEMGNLYLEDTSIDNRFEKATQYYLAAKQYRTGSGGCVQPALLGLGHMYLAQHQYAEACDAFKNSWHPEGLRLEAYLVEIGYDRPNGEKRQSLSDARYHYEEAVARGSIEALGSDGYLTMTSTYYGPEKYAVGLTSLLKGVKAKSVIAHARLGEVYKQGLAVEQDFAVALCLYGNALTLIREKEQAEKYVSICDRMVDLPELKKWVKQQIDMLKQLPTYNDDQFKKFNQHWQLAEKESPENCYQLGLMYREGVFGQPDEFKAKQYFMKASAGGHIEASGMLESGVVNETTTSITTTTTTTTAVAAPTTSIPISSYSTMDDDKALSTAIQFKEQGKYDEAFYILQLLVGKDNAEAKAELGEMYHYGYGVKCNLMIAERYYAPAIEKDVIKACINFGMLLKERDFKANYWEILRLFEKAEKKGSAVAAFYCGEISQQIGWDMDALIHFRTALNLFGLPNGGNPQAGKENVTYSEKERQYIAQACQHIGRFNEKKTGEKKDGQARYVNLDEAVYWYNKANEFQPGITSDAIASLKGEHPELFNRARIAVIKANYSLAVAGDVESLLNMAQLYHDGIFVEKDNGKAESFLKEACGISTTRKLNRSLDIKVDKLLRSGQQGELQQLQAKALFKLGEFYEATSKLGGGIKTRHCYEAAAKLGNAQASVKLESRSWLSRLIS